MCTPTTTMMILAGLALLDAACGDSGAATVGDAAFVGDLGHHDDAVATDLAGQARDMVTVGRSMDLAAPLARTQTVFVILMENHNWSDVKGSPSAPYINGTLLPLGAHAENYFNAPGIHPSEPNYIWLEAGTNFGITTDNPPATNHVSSTAHLATLLKQANVPWRAYEEDITGNDCPLTSRLNYAPKHDPFVFFDDSTGTLDPADAYCIAHNRPLTELATDLSNDTVARYNFVTPNLCHDMHDSCAPLHDEIKQGDTWLSQVVPTILTSTAYLHGGLVLITWDESELGDFPIGLIALSSTARPGYAGNVHYTHGSTLRSLEEIFHVTPLLGDAAHETDLADLFTAFP